MKLQRVGWFPIQSSKSLSPLLLGELAHFFAQESRWKRPNRKPGSRTWFPWKKLASMASVLGGIFPLWLHFSHLWNLGQNVSLSSLIRHALMKNIKQNIKDVCFWASCISSTLKIVTKIICRFRKLHAKNNLQDITSLLCSTDKSRSWILQREKTEIFAKDKSWNGMH